MPKVLKLDEIKNQINVPEMIQAIEDGFVLYSEDRVVVPPVGFLNFKDPPGDVHIKYGYVKGDDVYVLKVASGFYDNGKIGVPFADGVILVFSQKTGHLQVVLHDECWLTDMRTAAAGAVAAKHLAPDNVNCIGIIGTGGQARMQLELLKDIVDCQQCVVWGRDAAKVDKLVSDLRANPTIQNWGLQIAAAGSVEELASKSNLIVTTTSAREALVLADHVQAGTHITAMGSDDHGKQELEAALLGKADVVVADSILQCVDHGECFHAVKNGSISEDAIVELGNVIKNPRLGRTNDRQITVADLTGIAIQDIQIAKMASRA
ncbi:MAG: ornithine cyclodeaminase family protein [Proteobacteria bacterium]|nr:ornithine cyclodeaminase family protein [Pseudomonadota bacterium]MDA0994131.1 ornithine cyclodeaminase family protein [Pseudomonadota bacterium]